jgi:N-acetylneuraminate lyase
MSTAALKLRGLVAPVFTPFRADGSLNLDKVEQQAQHLARQGVVGVFVAGTTGEGLSLTIAERQQLLERWIAVVGKRLPVIAHVGHNCLADAKALAAHAQRAGATAIAAVPPSYYKPSWQAVIFCCEQVAAAAPSLPFYYYHIPGNTGVSLQLGPAMQTVAKRAPTLAGLKFSHNDLVDFARLAQWAEGEYDLFFGCDELLLAALGAGATAAIGSTYNFAAPLYRRMIDAFHAGDTPTAVAINQNVAELADMMKHFGGIPALKTAMRLRGVDCGPCRLPLDEGVTDYHMDLFVRMLDELVPVTPPG